MILRCFRSSPFALCFLVCTGLVLGCDWDKSTDPDQDLDPVSLEAGALHLGESVDVSDPESCQELCCKQSDCDLALVGYPADGGPQCYLVRCVFQGRDVCVLRPSTQFKVYRKKGKTETPEEEKKDGEKLRIVPLVGEPKTNETNDTNNIRCRLPMKVGSCRASFPKFYYDVTNETCRSFMYGGCGANGNNFESEQECEATCSGVKGSVLPDESTPAPPQRVIKAARMVPAFRTEVSQDAEGPVESEPAPTESQKTEMSADYFLELCGVKPDVGPCRAAFQHWYYNRETGNCESFIFGGCKGNSNNYHTKESCMATCAVTVLPSSKKVADDEVSTEYDYCVAAPDPGPCRAAFTNFYYDPNTGSCHAFTYGGCRGNKNRYGSLEECVERCSTDGVFNGRNIIRNRWTAAVFLFITVAAISALLLATLIIMSLRRRRLPGRPSSIRSDKEELLPDPDEQSSVESLPVPESPKPDKA